MDEGEFIMEEQDARILLVTSRITGEQHWEISYFDEEMKNITTKKIWEDYEDALGELDLLIELGADFIEYDEKHIVR